MEFEQTIVKMIQKKIKEIYGKSIELNLEFPPKIELGDLAINCFAIGRQVGKQPNEIASELVDELKNEPMLENVSATGPYVNLKIKSEYLFGGVINEVRPKPDQKECVMVEYLQPNTNKPLHLGHVRNGCLGMAISNILKANNYKVIKANLINDRGIHISKSMLAWQKWGNDETPESSGLKGDHFVGKWYIRYSQEVEAHPELEDEARELLQKWEANDKDVIELWKKMNSWVLAGFAITNADFGFVFDVEYFESNTYKEGKKIIEEGIEKKIFYKDSDGNIVVDLPTEEFGLDQNGQKKKVTLQRSDGTSLYMTQDLGTAKLKFGQYKLDKSIYIVGSEQEYHFKCLFSILKRLGYEWADKCYHLSYGMVYLPEGKMKSREGKVVDADDLLSQMTHLAEQEISSRDEKNSISKEEIEKRAAKIALAAIKFYLLKTNPKNDIYFDPKESIALEGATGPYCQYAYARAGKILEKAGDVQGDQADFSVLGNPEERILAQRLMNLNSQLEQAAKDYNPSKLAVAVYDLAAGFNQFYQKHQVINIEEEKIKITRIALVKATKEALSRGLLLLGIEPLPEM